MKTCIIGLGWLGQPLAYHLAQLGHQISGTTRSEDKRARLTAAGIYSMGFELNDMLCETSAKNKGFFGTNFNDTNIVINIAPGRRTIEVSPYVRAMCKLIQFLFERGAKHLTFVSTTSVFGEQTGRLNEDSGTSPTTGSGKAHAQIETYLISEYAANSAVLRLAGLIGLNPDGSLRHPVSSLIKRSAIANGHQAVNLLHQKDAISFISAIVNAQGAGIFHACSLQHPSRKEYYSWAAGQLGLGKVDFAEEENVSVPQGKIIDSTRSLNALGLKLQYPSPFDMI